MRDVDNYILQFEPEVQSRLTAIRQLFFEVFPEIEESISYNMPAYKVGNQQLYFAAYKNHIGFYPIKELPEIENQLKDYKAIGTKDTLHFLHNKPLPVNLIKRIIELKFN
ncbi:MAG: DUF1801 domain-containing protein [Pedobacter sp.]